MLFLAENFLYIIFNLKKLGNAQKKVLRVKMTTKNITNCVNSNDLAKKIGDFVSTPNLQKTLSVKKSEYEIRTKKCEVL